MLRVASIRFWVGLIGVSKRYVRFSIYAKGWGMGKYLWAKQKQACKIIAEKYPDVTA